MLARHGSLEVDSLRSNLETSIERENDIKEQLEFAEEEAKVLRKRLRDIEAENEALSKQLRKLSQRTQPAKADAQVHSETIQTEVIQLENSDLRNKNDQLHIQIEQLNSQVGLLFSDADQCQVYREIDLQHESDSVLPRAHR